MNRKTILRIAILSVVLLPSSFALSVLAFQIHDRCLYLTQHDCEASVTPCEVPSCTSWSEVLLWIGALTLIGLWFWIGDKVLKGSTPVRPAAIEKVE